METRCRVKGCRKGWLAGGKWLGSGEVHFSYTTTKIHVLNLYAASAAPECTGRSATEWTRGFLLSASGILERRTGHTRASGFFGSIHSCMRFAHRKESVRNKGRLCS